MHKACTWILGAAFVAASLTLSVASHAATLYNGWYYAIDAQDDGSGGSVYEERGLSFRTDGNTAYVAIGGNMPLGGVQSSSYLNGRINLGDLFFNFSAHNLDTTSKFTDPLVYGIRFDALNDSLSGVSGNGPDPTLGLFKNITAISLTTSNNGWSTLQNYNNAGFGRTTSAMGDLQSTLGDVKNYLGNGAQYPNIASGTKIGDITLLDRSQLTALGLDFGHFGADPNGNNVFGFSFDRTLLPYGDFTAHLFEECINDGVAIQAANVPEPGSMTLLSAGLIALSATLKKRRRSQ